MTPAHADIRGTSIAYQRDGDAGPDVIWGHGLAQTRATESVLGLIDWVRVPARVVRYDARGHGDSPTTSDPRGYAWDALARDQLALADALGIERYVAAGASMGCGTALHAAVLAPQRIERLALVIPPTGWETRAAQAGEWEQVATLIESEGVEPVIRAREQQPLPDPLAADREVRARQAEATRAWDPARLAQVMRGATHADLPPRHALATIACPTLILAWTGDPVHPLSTAEELHALIAGSQLHVATSADQLAGWTDLLAQFIQ